MLLFFAGWFFALPAVVAQRAGSRIAVMACHRQDEPAPALQAYFEAEPDLCLWIGDNVYADTEDDPGFIQACYDKLAARPYFQRLKAAAPFLATWDDHDFGLNNAGKEYPLKAESRQLFLDFWELNETVPAERPGIYYDHFFDAGGNRLQVIMLDVRYNRDAPGTGGDVLGEAQWQWLAEALRKPADLRLLVSGFQILLDADSGSETWALFPEARQRLFDLIRHTNAEGVVLLTGDQHYGEVARAPGAFDYDAVELQFASLNQIEAPERNSYRVSTVCESLHSYALIDIQWDTTEHNLPHLLFRVFDATTRQAEVIYRVNLHELNLHLALTPASQFTERFTVRATHTYPRLQVHYTLDGSRPSAAAPRYTEPIELKATTRLRARLFDEAGNARGREVSRTYPRTQPLEAVPDRATRPGLRYRYYEGAFAKLPDFPSLTPVDTGTTQSLAPAPLAGRPDHYALVFEGFVAVPQTGLYEFFTLSDDGSRLYVHEQLVVDNGGSHSARLRSGRLALAKGLHPLRLQYFEDYAGETLEMGAFLITETGERKKVDVAWRY